MARSDIMGNSGNDKRILMIAQKKPTKNKQTKKKAAWLPRLLLLLLLPPLMPIWVQSHIIPKLTTRWCALPW